jgi:signal transduction histidine kinase
MLPRRLRSLSLVFAVAFTTSIIGTGVAVHHLTLTTISELVDRRIADASQIAAGNGTGLQAILRRMATLSSQRHTGDIGIQLDGTDGNRLGGNIALTRPLPLGFSDVDVRAGIVGLSSGRAFVRLLPNGMRLTTIAETEPFDHYGKDRIRIYLFGFGSIVLVVIAGTAAFGTLVHRRISETRHTVNAIFDGDMRTRVPVTGGGGTFDEQAIAFNRMLDRISELMEGISNLSNDIAHDLRTPLSRLRMRLDGLVRAAPSEELSGRIEQARDDCDEMLAMFAAVLRIAEVQGGARRAAFASLDLGQLVEELATMMEPLVADQGRRMALGPFASVWIEGDRQLLSQAIINLIENAIRHTPKGSRIAVAALAASGGAVLVVEDDGPGIQPADRERALRRFGRLDRSRNTPGHGLGLALVATVARLHRGTLDLGDAAPGLRVEVTLPRQ